MEFYHGPLHHRGGPTWPSRPASAGHRGTISRIIPSLGGGTSAHTMLMLYKGLLVWQMELRHHAATIVDPRSSRSFPKTVPSLQIILPSIPGKYKWGLIFPRNIRDTRDG